MDIEEIKKRLSRDNPARDRCLADGVLWLIEQLEQAYDLQVARLEPGDVVVFQISGKVTDHVIDKILQDSERLFPGHKAVVLEDGMTLSVVRKASIPVPDCGVNDCTLGIRHSHASFADVVDAYEAQRDG